MKTLVLLWSCFGHKNLKLLSFFDAQIIMIQLHNKKEKTKKKKQRKKKKK